MIGYYGQNTIEHWPYHRPKYPIHRRPIDCDLRTAARSLAGSYQSVSVSAGRNQRTDCSDDRYPTAIR